MVVDFTNGFLPLGAYYRLSGEIITRYKSHFIFILLLILLPASVMEQEWFLRFHRH